MENENTEKKKNNKVIFIICSIIVAIAIFGCGVFVGNRLLSKDKCAIDDNNTNSNDNSSQSNYEIKKYDFNNFKPETLETKPADDNELTKGIEIKNIYFNPNYTNIGEYRYANVLGKNKNSEPVHVTIIAEYYDAEGLRIDKRSSTIFVYPDTEFVSQFYVIDDTKYKTAKISYTTSKIKSYETSINAKDFEITTNIDSRKDIYYFITNKSNKKVYSFISCIYYKNGKEVFAVSRSFLGIEAAEKKQENFDRYNISLEHDYNADLIEFDDYKVFISGAYNSDDENY